MNSMIEQLAVEAAEAVISEPCDLNMQTEDELGNKIVVPATFIEKFAELIVLKCAMVGNYAHDGGEYPSQMIKEYFGVE